jgi:dethiobiotin synthase
VPLTRLSTPGLFITGTDIGVGKTLVAGAIADWFRRREARVAVCKPIATGCVWRREGLVSEEAEFLAHCAAAPHPLDLIAPQRYASCLAPALAAEAEDRPVDWSIIDSALRSMSADADLTIAESPGGVAVAGVVINRYPADTPGAAEELNPRAIERWGRVPVLAYVPEIAEPFHVLPPDVAAAMDLVDWARVAALRRLNEPARSRELR